MSVDLKAPLSIELTQGKFAIVSAEDFPVLSLHKWHAVRCSNKWYARRSQHKPGSRSTMAFSMHREVPTMRGAALVDHINGDGLDNRRENLRSATPQQNALNLHARNFSEGSRGVFLQKGKFIARIGDTYAGCFETQVEAAFRANQILDELSPGVGYRNTVDFEALLSIVKSRRSALDDLVMSIEGARDGK